MGLFSQQCSTHLVYNTLNLDFYNSLIFGDFGQITGENPLQIQSACQKIKTLPNMQKSGKYLKQQIFSQVKKVATKNVI